MAMGRQEGREDESVKKGDSKWERQGETSAKGEIKSNLPAAAAAGGAAAMEAGGAGVRV